MKKFKLLIISAVMGILFIGCQNKDEGLTTDNFKTKATIQGNVYYSQGQDFIDFKYIVDKRVNAKGKTIYLDVQTSEYKPGSVGVITYSAVIDTAGNYKFTVPVKVQGITNATLRLEQFISKRQVYDNKINLNTPVFKTEDAVFSFTKDIALSNGSISVENLNYNFTPVAIPNTYNDYILFEGNLNLAYEKGFRDGSFKSAVGKSVEITVDYPELGGSFQFGTTVDQTGKYIIRIPVVSRKNALTATFTPIGFLAFDYLHFATSSEQKTLTGYYYCDPITITTEKDLSQEISYNIGSNSMFFYPASRPSTWQANLVGWIQLNPSVYNYPITLTGNILAANEKSYLVGDYSPIAGKTVGVTVNYGTGYTTQTYIVATDNTGKYTLPIMTPKSNMPINISVDVESFGITNYTHYMSDGTSTQLNGWYKTSYYDITNKVLAVNEFTSSYNLDNLYRVFTPVDVSVVKDWYTNLFGWHQIIGTKGNVSITGAIKKAVEGSPDLTKPTAWQVATWANASNQPFIITVGGKSLLGITNSVGQYSLIFPVDYIIEPTVSNTLTIGLSSSIAKVSNFIHYSDINSSAISIQGSYTVTIAPSACAIVDGTTCTVNDCKMLFTPTTIPTGWSGYLWK